MEDDALELRGDPAATYGNDQRFSPIRLYPSSLAHRTDGTALLSVVCQGPGLRLTRAQAEELRDYLDTWLNDTAPVEQTEVIPGIH